MNDNERAEINMFDVVWKICKNNYPILSAYAPFVIVFTEFDSKLDELKGYLGQQLLNREGITLDKKKRRKLLETDTLLLSSLLGAYATLTGLDELLHRVKYTVSDFRRAADKEMVGISHQLLKDANDNLTGLAPYLIDAAWLTAYEAKINDFLSYVDAPANARSEIKKATANIKRLVTEIKLWLRNCVDPMMYHFQEEHGLIYANYKNGRKTVKVGSHTPALKGTVKDTEGNAAVGLMVRIDGTLRKSKTTAKGNFRFIRLKTGKYTLIVLDKKKELIRVEAEVPYIGRLEIEVDMG